MIVSIIAAIGRNNELGLNNKMLWHLPADLKFFKETTTGHCIVMGRKTFESIGRALPNRNNLVISRNKAFTAEGIKVFESVEDAVKWARQQGETECFITGGAEIYKHSIHHVTKLYLTRVDSDFEADTWFPKIDFAEWELVESKQQEADEKNAYPLTFELWKRKVVM